MARSLWQRSRFTGWLAQGLAEQLGLHRLDRSRLRGEFFWRDRWSLVRGAREHRNARDQKCDTTQRSRDEQDLPRRKRRLVPALPLLRKGDQIISGLWPHRLGGLLMARCDGLQGARLLQYARRLVVLPSLGQQITEPQ
jgi:hypothetical protein